MAQELAKILQELAMVQDTEVKYIHPKFDRGPIGNMRARDWPDEDFRYAGERGPTTACDLPFGRLGVSLLGSCAGPTTASDLSFGRLGVSLLGSYDIFYTGLILTQPDSFFRFLLLLS